MIFTDEKILTESFYIGVIIIMIMDIVTLGSSKSAKGHARHITHVLPTVTLKDRL